jgi:hypothetical protein
MKHILIPTDFTIKSLKLVRAAVDRFPGEVLHITLVHALEPDHSISGLLMMSKRLSAHKLCTQEFTDACEVLQNKYTSAVQRIKVEFYYGSTKAYMKNFLEARKIDAVILAKDYTLKKPSPSSRDMYPGLIRSGYPVHWEELQQSTQKAFSETASLSALLPA